MNTENKAGENNAVGGVQEHQTLADASERQQALDTSRSFIVQAPAGSGKTELLIRRVLSLLLVVDQPEQILAITFTRKAAAEMRNRIRNALQQAGLDQCWEEARDNPHMLDGLAIAKKVLQRDHQLSWGLLDNPLRLNLTTIDAFCTRLTRAQPITSRLGAPPSAEDNVSDLYQSAAIRTIQAGLAASSVSAEALRRLLARLDNNVMRLAELLADMLSQRDQLLRLGDYAYSRETLENSIVQIVEYRLQLLVDSCPAALDEGKVYRTAAFASEAFKALGNDKGGLADLFDQLTEMPKASINDLKRWRALAALLLTNDGKKLRTRITKGEGFPSSAADAKILGVTTDELKSRKVVLVELLDALRENPATTSFIKALHAARSLPTTGYTEEQWQTLEDLFTTLTHAVAELQVEFATALRCDFTQIAMGANRALGDERAPTELALELDYRLQHILVDEFQDTSNSQFALFEKIVEGWQPGDGRTFYAVGDPMQSIYRFRHAEVALFDQARDHGINDLPLQALQLSVNFRSTPELIDWCNQTFTTIFPTHADRDRGAVVFSSSSSPLAGKKAAQHHVHWHITKPESQARKIALVARELLDGDSGRTHAVLVRSRTNLEEMFLALRDAGVPCQAIEMESLSQRPVVEDILSLTSALLYPHDRVAWLSLLRAPWCGLTLSEIHALVGEDVQREPVWMVLSTVFADESTSAVSGLSETSIVRLRKFMQVMRPAVESAGRDQLVPWVESCWQKLGGVAVCADSSDIEAADSMFELLASLQQSGEVWNKTRVKERLNRLFAPTLALKSDHVQVMTIHKSKGLEFDSVLLPNLERKVQGDSSRLLNWFESVDVEGNVNCVMAPLDTRINKNKRGTGSADPIGSLIKHYHRERADNETLRLLYVAATRAKSALHLFASTKPDDGSESNAAAEVKPDASSLLAKLWPAVESDIAQAQIDDADTQSSDNAESNRQEQHTVLQSNLYRLPVDWTWPRSAVVFSWPENTADANPLDDARDLLRPEFLWAGIDAAAIGTVVHQQLQTLCQLGSDFWHDVPADERRYSISLALASMGLGGKRLDKGVSRVERAIEQCLNDERGRWLLDNTHMQSEAEYALTEWRDGAFQNIVIDRIFVDEGIRWIVDYKTGDHAGGAVDEFLDREQERYAPQLERYAAIVASQSAEPVRLGLYFPLLQGWRTWQASITVT